MEKSSKLATPQLGKQNTCRYKKISFLKYFYDVLTYYTFQLDSTNLRHVTLFVVYAKYQSSLNMNESKRNVCTKNEIQLKCFNENSNEIHIR